MSAPDYDLGDAFSLRAQSDRIARNVQGAFDAAAGMSTPFERDLLFRTWMGITPQSEALREISAYWAAQGERPLPRLWPPEDETEG